MNERARWIKPKVLGRLIDLAMFQKLRLKCLSYESLCKLREWRHEEIRRSQTGGNE